MRHYKTISNKHKIIGSLALILALSSCGEAPKVPPSECKAVVKHVKSVLGKFAPGDKEIMSQCKAATDEARGCAMAAKKPMKLTQCDF